MPVAVEAMHELVPEGREALRIALGARLGRVDGAYARRALRHRLRPVRAAEDVEERLAAAQRLAHRLGILDPVPDDGDARIGRGCRTAGKRKQDRGAQEPHLQAKSMRPTSRPSAYFTPTMRPFRRAMSR